MDRIINEFNEFKKEVLSLSKEEIFEEHFKINFYCEVKECIVDMKLELKESTTLFGLWEFFLDREFASTDNYDSIIEMIKEYEEEY